MIRQLKAFTLRLVAGANVVTIVLMLLVGYSGRLNPDIHPMLSNANLLFPVFIVINLAFLVFWLLFKWRWALIPFAGYLVCYVPMRQYTPFNVSREAPPGSIKILSYNVHGFSGLGSADGTPKRLLSYIAAQDADIVCLQEANIGHLEAMADSILGNLYPYREDVRAADGGDRVAVWSKYPVVRKERVEYSSKGNLSAAFYLKLPKDTLLVVNNHLETTGLSPEDRSQFKSLVKGELRDKQVVERASRLLIYKLAEATAKRAPQARAVARYVKDHQGTPMIVCGDFNDGPQSYSLLTVAEGLTDCYVSTANGPGISYNRNGFFVRIDHVLCSNDWIPYNCRVDRKIKDSDHYPIICWVKKRSEP